MGKTYDTAATQFPFIATIAKESRNQRTNGPVNAHLTISKV